MSDRIIIKVQQAAGLSVKVPEGFQGVVQVLNDVDEVVAVYGNDLCRCGDCGWVGNVSEASEVHDFWSRVEPGDIMPSGDCPSCGALVHPIPKDLEIEPFQNDWHCNGITFATKEAAELYRRGWRDARGIVA